ncbi:unnamed protein product [Allacma fusca]|uniref:Protein transport protein sec16 n=1 Tax=Allacma fusca TaxID=39272 RepID=A0A8J2KQH8_9HEXA|nr:unnamed protein product [Allacma fusca]
MYSQQESGWADGQLNENNERTDDLDGAAEGDNDSSRINVQNQTAPSRPRSRDSYYDRDRDMRDRGESEYYGSRSSRNHGHGTEPRRRRNESYRDGRDRGRMDDYEYEYRDSRRTRHVPERQYPDSYYMGGYGGSSRGGYGNPQQGIREMLERLRVQDPIRYREWYDQYQAHRRNPQRVPNPGLPVFGYGGPPPSMTPVGGYPYFPGVPASNHSMSMYAEPSGVDRQSVHSDAGRPSGRSSVNELLSFSGYANGPSVNQTPSINQDPDAAGFKPIDPHYHKTPEPERMTPLKFNTSHCLGVLTPLGQLIKIKSQGSAVEIVQVKSLMAHLPEYKEVSAFPGPLVKGTTHKNTVIQFCQKKIKEAQHNDAQPDKQHFVLLWELLILLLRQNGNVVGSDVAELLLKKQNTPSDSASSSEEYQSRESSEEEEIGVNGGGVNLLQPANETKITEKFCEFLLYGHKKDAVEYAMNNGLWGHALFLATKMDERTYGNVLARFANCTPFNHPIQTFYQLMSGRQPASAKSCCDDTFGDWKPHLAMILSNAGSRPEVEFKAIVKMGDTLGNKNHIFAAQFCYLMGQTDFSAQSKLGPLLGLSTSAENITEATQMTEIYEFARSLAEPTFTLGPSFLNSKLNYTKTLLDLGFVEEAFAYCEEMAKKLKLLNGSQNEDLSILKWSILQIAERLVRVEESETGEDPRWISELRNDLNSTVSGGQVSDNMPGRRESVPDNQVIQNHDVPTGHEAPQDYEYREQLNPGYIPEYPNTDPMPTASADQNTPGMNKRIDPQAYQPTQPMYPDPIMANNPQIPMISDQGNSADQLHYNPSQHMQPGFMPDYPNFPNNNYITPGGGYPMPSYGQPPPLTDGPLGPSTGANKGFDHPQQNFPPQPQTRNQGDSQNKNQEKKDKGLNKGGGDAKKQGGGFLSGLFSKFKGPNQMILPDDKDPPIVWDENSKKWVNKTGDEDEDSGPKGPPPTDRDLMGNPGMPPPMMSMPPQTQHMGGPPPIMQPMAHSQPNMMAQPGIPQQQPFHNQTLPARPDSMPSASNVPLNAPGIQTQPIGNNYQQQNPNNFVEGYQNNNQSYSAAPLNNPSDPSMTGMGMGPNMNGPPTLASNKYKLPKNRNVRSGYVDVLNPNSNTANSAD